MAIDPIGSKQRPTGFGGPQPGENTAQRKVSTIPQPSAHAPGQPWGAGAEGGEYLGSTHTGTFYQQIDPNYEVVIWNPYNDGYERYAYQELVDNGVLPGYLTYGSLNAFKAKGSRILADLWGAAQEPTGGSGRSGGGGATGPTYVKPDERLVRESVKSTLSALAGKVNPGFLDELVGVYMSENKRSFDLQKTEQIDPMESVKAKIRETSEYKAIHALRPESTDEYDWVGSRQGALKRAGVTDLMSETLGIAQATAGSSDEEAATAGNIATFSQSTQQLSELRNRFRSATYSALRLA